MRPIPSLVAALALIAAVPASAGAASISVPIDQSTRLTINGAAYSVLVGSPTVADVTVVDSRTLFISGRGYGTTDVVVLDRLGATLYSGEIVVTAPDLGRVSVYRGPARTDHACAPHCQVSVRSVGAGGGGAAAGGAAPAAAAGPMAGAVAASAVN